MTAPANGPANAAQAPDSGVGRGYVKVPGIVVVTVLILATLILTDLLPGRRVAGQRFGYRGDLKHAAGGPAPARRRPAAVHRRRARRLPGRPDPQRPFAVLVRRQPEPAAQLAGDVRFAALHRRRAGHRVLRRAARRPGGGADRRGPAKRVRLRGRLGAGRLVLPGGGGETEADLQHAAHHRPGRAGHVGARRPGQRRRRRWPPGSSPAPARWAPPSPSAAGISAGTTSVIFQGATVSPSAVSDTSVSVVVPAGAATGPVRLEVGSSLVSVPGEFRVE